MGAPGLRYPYGTVSSGLLSESAAVRTRAGLLRTVLAYTDGDNDATVTVYDHATTNSGTVLAKVVVLAADRMGGETNIQVTALNGLYVVVAGTGASYLVRHGD